MTSTTMACEDLAREALEPIAKAASILTDDGGWRETDVLELIAENGDREYVGSLTVRDLRRARTAYDAMGSGVKADEPHLTIGALQRAHVERQEEWCPDQKPDLSFRGNEMAGEVGEACNVIKKLERERHGWRGSRATTDDLGDELADVVHTAVLCAITAGIELEPRVVAKFNATSEKNGLATRLSTHTAAGAGPVGEAVVLDDYLSDAQARELFGLEDDEALDEDRIRVCQGEWVRIPGGYYFDKSVGLLHPETANDEACDDCAVSIARPVEEPGEVERDEAPQMDGGFLTKSERAAIDKLGEATSLRRELAETRECLEKREQALQEIATWPIAESGVNYRALARKLTDMARAALTGDAQEAGR